VSGEAISLCSKTRVFRVLAIRFDVIFCKIHNLVTVNFYPKNSTDLKSWEAQLSFDHRFCYAVSNISLPKLALKLDQNFVLGAILRVENFLATSHQKVFSPCFARAKSPQIGFDDGRNTPSPAPN
jgi:hypothetical protein